MENHINACLKLDNVFDSKDIYPKVSKIPATPFLKNKLPSEHHRKNNSMNILEQSPKSVDPPNLFKKSKGHHSY